MERNKDNAFQMEYIYCLPSPKSSLESDKDHKTFLLFSSYTYTMWIVYTYAKKFGKMH